VRLVRFGLGKTCSDGQLGDKDDNQLLRLHSPEAYHSIVILHPQRRAQMWNQTFGELDRIAR
jgi:hypothetical protein